METFRVSTDNSSFWIFSLLWTQLFTVGIGLLGVDSAKFNVCVSHNAGDYLLVEVELDFNLYRVIDLIF